VAVALVPGTAAAQVTPFHDGYRVTHRDSVFSPCTDELIELNITFSNHFTGVEQPSGQIKYTTHFLTTGEGEGSLGDHYRMSQTSLTNELYAPDGTPYDIIESSDIRVIGQGDAPDFLLCWRERMTVSASGVRAVYFEHYSAECDRVPWPGGL
jgi:hypothetical protein